MDFAALESVQTNESAHREKEPLKTSESIVRFTDSQLDVREVFFKRAVLNRPKEVFF